MTAAAGPCNALRWLSIVGIGEDGAEGLSPAARRLVTAAELVVGGRRHLDLARTLITGETMAWPSPLHQAFPTIAARRGRPVTVLASGDPFQYGVGTQLAEHFAVDEMLVIPQASAFSLAAARMGWSLPDTTLVTLHGRPLQGIIRHLTPGARILALSWDGTTPDKLARLLTERGMGGSRLTVLEAMGGVRERRLDGRASAFPQTAIDPLNTIAIEVEAAPGAPVPLLSAGLPDSLFESDGQLTKREVRAVTLAALAPRPGAHLWDIGLGAGSVAIEWLLRHPKMRATGIEERRERAERAGRNALALGTPDLEIVVGTAPAALSGLAPPDAVFIGGGISEPGLFEAAWGALKPGGRLVANAVSLEGEQRLLSLFAAHGGEMIRIALARAEPVGTMHGWRAAMPVTQWQVVKP